MLPSQSAPESRAVLRQSWRDLLFLHFCEDPAAVQASLPTGLEVDTFPDEHGRARAWIGLVAFRMEGIRPEGGFAVPWLSNFPETNVRTYVRRNGAAPGVWFYSLDAARWPACAFARATYGLPYHHARMTTSAIGSDHRYASDRYDQSGSSLRIEAQVGGPISASPGSLAHFLCERYRLYAVRRGVLGSGRVAHAPYPLRNARVVSCRQNLTDAAGFAARPWTHVCFSPGVDVEVFALRPE